MPIPDNVELDETAYLETSYSFHQFRSRRTDAVVLDRAAERVVWAPPSISGPTLGSASESSHLVNAAQLIIDGDLDIGDHVLISWGVVVMDTYRVAVDPDARRRGDPAPVRPVKIAPDCWIGFGASILPGTELGRGSIVAARSVVAGTVDPYTVVAGNPAVPSVDSPRSRDERIAVEDRGHRDPVLLSDGRRDLSVPALPAGAPGPRPRRRLHRGLVAVGVRPGYQRPHRRCHRERAQGRPQPPAVRSRGPVGLPRRGVGHADDGDDRRRDRPVVPRRRHPAQRHRLAGDPPAPSPDPDPGLRRERSVHVPGRRGQRGAEHDRPPRRPHAPRNLRREHRCRRLRYPRDALPLDHDAPAGGHGPVEGTGHRIRRLPDHHDVEEQGEGPGPRRRDVSVDQTSSSPVLDPRPGGRFGSSSPSRTTPRPTACSRPTAGTRSPRST